MVIISIHISSVEIDRHVGTKLNTTHLVLSPKEIESHVGLCTLVLALFFIAFLEESARFERQSPFSRCLGVFFSLDFDNVTPFRALY
jgi:hypothetical protein